MLVAAIGVVAVDLKAIASLSTTAIVVVVLVVHAVLVLLVAAHWQALRKASCLKVCEDAADDAARREVLVQSGAPSFFLSQIGSGFIHPRD